MHDPQGSGTRPPWISENIREAVRSCPEEVQ
jgi:hypothetical protein